MKNKHKMHLKRKIYKSKKTTKIALIFVLIIISIIFNKKALPQFIDYSKIEVKKIISSIISSSVNNEIATGTDKNNLLDMVFDKDGNVVSIDFNSNLVNKLLVDACNIVDQNLKYVETGQTDKLNLLNTSYDIDNLKDGIIYELPSGIIVNNPIMYNIFPKIPVKINLIGNTFCKLSTDIKSYGINNALITVNLEITVDVRILLPFTTNEEKVVTDIPMIMKLVEGNVPSYYLDGYLNSPYVTNSVQ